MGNTDTIDGLIQNLTGQYDTVARWPSNDPGSDGGPPRTTRRLSDKVLSAFHRACDQRDFEVAGRLLGVLELIITRPPVLPATRERQFKESLVAAYERLWALRHPDSTQG